MRKNYQRKDCKSNHKFEVVGGQERLVRVPLPIAEVWAEVQAQVEELTEQAGLQILGAILENEVTHRVGPPHRPNPTAGCVRWGTQPGFVVFAGQKIPNGRGSEPARARKWNWLTPIAEQHPTTKTLEPSDTFCRLFTLAFATGTFPDGERKPSLIGIDCLMCRHAKFRPLASHGTL